MLEAVVFAKAAQKTSSDGFCKCQISCAPIWRISLTRNRCLWAMRGGLKFPAAHFAAQRTKMQYSENHQCSSAIQEFLPRNTWQRHAGNSKTNRHYYRHQGSASKGSRWPRSRMKMCECVYRDAVAVSSENDLARGANTAHIPDLLRDVRSDKQAEVYASREHAVAGYLVALDQTRCVEATLRVAVGA